LGGICGGGWRWSPRWRAAARPPAGVAAPTDPDLHPLAIAMPRISVPFARPQAGPIATAARAVTPVRLRRQPTAQFVARLTVTALFAYLVALLLAGSPRPVLAPLTAVLVVQATLYQTIRNAVQRVASVVAGVLVALALSAAVGFTWWSLGLT